MRITDKRTTLLAVRQLLFRQQWKAEDARATATGLDLHRAAATVKLTSGKIQHLDRLLDAIEAGETKCPECDGTGVVTCYDPGDRDCGMPASSYRDYCGACHGLDLDAQVERLAAEVKEPQWLEVA